MTLNLVPSSALRILGKMPGPALMPVAATGTSRFFASSRVLIGLVLQVTQERSRHAAAAGLWKELR